MSDLSTLDLVRAHAQILHADEHYTEVLRHIGAASLVLLGEATHGTREFYQARAEISKRLITEQGFDAIAVEADWPDALRVSRYVQHVSHEKTADEALGGFERFPRWMWRNTEVLDFIYWLRLHNLGIASPAQRIGFFGLDIYSLHKSIAAVLRYLDALDPDAARHARERYGCFDHLAEHPQRYAHATMLGLRPDCEEAVVRQLTALHAQASEFLLHGGPHAADELFYAQQNARVAKNAEAYYRAMFRGRDTSWNVRDAHMAETLQALRAHLSERTGHPAKIIVWAHNSHIGDARATEMGQHGQLNLGQLVREHYAANEVSLIGFTTYGGTVTAAPNWDAAPELKAVNPARADSIEGLLHETGLGNFFLPLRNTHHDEFPAVLSAPYKERAIGVVYLPHSETVSHYFEADVTQQFDALIHFDQTHAVKPLDPSPAWVHDEVPDTYPFGV
jgi:erythromycin esterase-like protein